MVVVKGVRCTPYIIGDVAYQIQPYLQKNWKTCNVVDVDKQRYDSSMNLVRVIIKNAFGSLKKGGAYWDILIQGVLKLQKLLLLVVFFTTIV